MVMIDLSFIILTWNSEKYISRCLESFINQCDTEHISWEIIIIDNGSNDGTAEKCKKYSRIYSEQFFLLSLESNLGTTYPRNLGLQKARGKYCCILDSDTEFNSGCIQDVIKLIEDEQVGICVPQLLLPGGMVQHSVKKFPTFLDKIKKIPGILYGKNITKSDFYENFPFVEMTSVGTAISACWFFRKSLLEHVGYLDEKIFYAPEDIDYCLRVNKAGMQIIYYPFVSVKHHTQQISHRKPFSKVSMSHFFGLLYYFKKHGGWLRRPVFSHTQQ